MNETIKLLNERKSVRKFTDEKISDEVKQIIINSALTAPTAGNMTLYSIIDITDQSIKDTLASSCDNQPFIAEAPLVLLFVADYQKWYDAMKITNGQDIRKPASGDLMLAVSDALIAASNVVVASESMGLGSCFIGDVIEQYEIHQKLFNLPKYTFPACLLVLGYPTENQKLREKPVRFDEKYVVSNNTYHQLNNEELLEMFNDKANRSNMNITGEQLISNLYKRKWSQPFIEEMTRSVNLWLKQWNND